MQVDGVFFLYFWFSEKVLSGLMKTFLHIKNDILSVILPINWQTKLMSSWFA